MSDQKIAAIKENRVCFQHEMTEDSEQFDFIYLNDAYGWTELWAFEVDAILDLRRHVEAMLDDGGEMAFTDLVERSRELEQAFLKVVTTLKMRGVKS